MVRNPDLCSSEESDFVSHDDVAYSQAPYVGAGAASFRGTCNFIPSLFHRFPIYEVDLGPHERSVLMPSEELMARIPANPTHNADHSNYYELPHHLQSQMESYLNGSPNFHASQNIFCAFGQCAHFPRTSATMDSSGAIVTANSGSPQGVELLTPSNICSIENAGFPCHQPFLTQPMSTFMGYLGCPFACAPVNDSNATPGYYPCAESAPGTMFGQYFSIPASLPSYMCSHILGSECAPAVPGLCLPSVAAGLRVHLSSQPHVTQERVALAVVKPKVGPSSPPLMTRRKKRLESDKCISSLVDDATAGPSSDRQLRRKKPRKSNPSSAEVNLEGEFKIYEQQRVRYFNDGVEVDTHGRPLVK